MIGVSAQIGLGRKDDISQRHFVISRKATTIAGDRFCKPPIVCRKSAEISLAIFSAR
jgi:hypothetical protein